MWLRRGEAVCVSRGSPTRDGNDEQQGHEAAPISAGTASRIGGTWPFWPRQRYLDWPTCIRHIVYYLFLNLNAQQRGLKAKVDSLLERELKICDAKCFGMESVLSGGRCLTRQFDCECSQMSCRVPICSLAGEAAVRVTRTSVAPGLEIWTLHAMHPSHKFTSVQQL